MEGTEVFNFQAQARNSLDVFMEDAISQTVLDDDGKPYRHWAQVGQQLTYKAIKMFPWITAGKGVGSSLD